jgi:D-tyrosyl-tRNA(Tyr) deacylase
MGVRAVVQRVSAASVTVAGEAVGAIGRGLAVLLGVKEGDTEADAGYLAEKTAGLRVFADSEGRMNLSVEEIGGAVLVVSQFTLYGDARKGRRPSYARAAGPESANRLYEAFAAQLAARGLTVATGRFGAMMLVNLVGDGPVTILLDSERLF